MKRGRGRLGIEGNLRWGLWGIGVIWCKDVSFEGAERRRRVRDEEAMAIVDGRLECWGLIWFGIL